MQTAVTTASPPPARPAHPIASHVVLRPCTSAEYVARPDVPLASVHLLTYFFPTVLTGRVVRRGDRIRDDALRCPPGVEAFEVVDVEGPKQQEGATPQPSVSAACFIAPTTVISMQPPIRTHASSALAVPPVSSAFPVTVEQWRARIKTRVYGYDAQVRLLLETIWCNVRQYLDETAETAAQPNAQHFDLLFDGPPLSAYSPRTFLLHGLSGTGKSHLAHAVAGTSGLPYYLVHASALLCATEGDSEAGLVRVFQAARQKNQPCLILLDEIDTILPRATGDEDLEAQGDDDDLDLGAGLKQDAGGSSGGWNMGNARVEWRMASVLKQLLREVNGLDLPLPGDFEHDSSLPSLPPPPIFVFFTTSSPANLDACSLRQSPYVDVEVELRALTADERAEALAVTMRKFVFDGIEHTHDGAVGSDAVEIASARRRLFASLAGELHGYVGADIDGFVRETLLAALHRTQREVGSVDRQITVADVVIREADYRQVLQWYRPSNLQQLEYRMPLSSSSTEELANDAATTTLLTEAADSLAPLPFCALARHFASLGGITPLLEHLHYSFLLPIKQPRLYREICSRRLGMKASSGVLVYGPSGTGKTSLALSLARACGLNALVVPATALASKVLGTAEKTLAALFAKARASAPALLVFDQMETIAPVRKGLVSKRNNGARDNDEDDEQRVEADSYERILSVLLIEMDGVLATSADPSQQVYIVATSTRPDQIDPALVRPGRLDTHVRLPKPDQRARYEILELIMRPTPLLVEVDAATGRILIPCVFSLLWTQLDAAIQDQITEVDWNHTTVPTATVAASSPAPSSKSTFLLLLSHMTHDYSGADLVALQRESAMHALRADLNSTVVRSWTDVLVGTFRHMAGSLADVREYHPFGQSLAADGGADWSHEFGTLSTETSNSSSRLFTKKSTDELAQKRSRETHALLEAKAQAWLRQEQISVGATAAAAPVATTFDPSAPFVFTMPSDASTFAAVSAPPLPTTFNFNFDAPASHPASFATTAPAPFDSFVFGDAAASTAAPPSSSFAFSMGASAAPPTPADEANSAAAKAKEKRKPIREQR